MKRVCLLNGSLRGEKASSLQFLNRVSDSMKAPDFHVDRLTLKAHGDGRPPGEALAALASADVLVMAFPLFCYTLPGALTGLLEDFHAYVQEGGRRNARMKVFAIINCGFPDPGIISEAIRVVKNFCTRLGLSYRFAVAIGTGPATVMTMKIPLLNPRLKKALMTIVEDAGCDRSTPREDVFITPIIPKAILLRIKEYYERTSPAL